MVGIGTSASKSLSEIPSKVVLMICDYLPPADLKCLSFCNRRFQKLYRMHHSSLPPLTWTERLSILVRLDRDFREASACCICHKLHWYDGPESFGLSGRAEEKISRLRVDYKIKNPERQLSGQSSMIMRTHVNYFHTKSRLYNVQVKLAIRRFYYGPKGGISTESLSYTQVRTYLHAIPETKSIGSDLQYLHVPTLFSKEAQICPESLGLYIRMQDILSYKMWEGSEVNFIIDPLRHYEICYHQPLESKRGDLDQLRRYEKQYLDYTCSACTVVCHIEMVESESLMCLIMTRWFNLGTGADRNDALWRAHSYETDRNDPLWKAHSYGCAELPDRPHIPQNIRSARLCFEYLAPEKFNQLRDRNLSYLEKEKYKACYPFVQDKPDLWHIPHKDTTTKWILLKICIFVDDLLLTGEILALAQPRMLRSQL